VTSRSGAAFDRKLKSRPGEKLGGVALLDQFLRNCRERRANRSGEETKVVEGMRGRRGQVPGQGA
jgi:hypothetical protein